MSRKVLIIFETVEGQTGKIGRYAADHARALAEIVNIADVDSADRLSVNEYTHVILAAPVHERRHPRKFEALLAAKRRDLDGLKTLFLSVSLNAAFPEGLEEAQDYVAEMSMRTGFEPGRTALVAGAIQTDKYDYFATQVVRYVVLRGKKVDLNETHHEFTDWDALAKTISAFLHGD